MSGTNRNQTEQNRTNRNLSISRLKLSKYPMSQSESSGPSLLRYELYIWYTKYDLERWLTKNFVTPKRMNQRFELNLESFHSYQTNLWISLSVYLQFQLSQLCTRGLTFIVLFFNIIITVFGSWTGIRANISCHSGSVSGAGSGLFSSENPSQFLNFGLSKNYDCWKLTSKSKVYTATVAVQPVLYQDKIDVRNQTAASFCSVQVFLSHQ